MNEENVNPDNIIQSGLSSKKYAILLNQFNKDTLNKNFRLYLIRIDRKLILRIEGKANSSGYAGIAERALEIINSKEMDALVIDLNMCEFLASSPLGLIGMMMMVYLNRGGKVFIICKNPTILKSLRVLGLDKICKIHDALDDIGL